MRKLCWLMILGVSFLLSSCKTSEKIVYFQDIQPGQQEQINNTQDITVQPQDEISIIVSSKDPKLAALFNLTRAQYRAGYDNLSGGNYGEISGYTVDQQGNIDFPVLGKVNVVGLSRNEIADKIKNLLIKNDLIKDPVVTVGFMNLYFSLLGEVNRPDKYNITKDRITLLEAISTAGDLTIYGKRNDVLVIREENGQRKSYRVDLRSSKLFNSPVYYLKQNDVVYVEPNKVRAGQSTINENNVKSVSLWISVGSFLSSLGVLLFK